MNEKYQQVVEMRKQNPDLSVAKICKRVGMNMKTYYSYKLRLDRGTNKPQKRGPKPGFKRKKLKPEFLALPEIPAKSNKMVVIVADIQDLQQILGGVM